MSYEEFTQSIEGFEENYAGNISSTQYFGFPTQAILNIEEQLEASASKNIAYFSMEFGLAPSIYNTFLLNKPISKNNQFFTHEVFSNYWLCDYLFKIKINKMLDIPIYGGGLGVLAGDSMKSIADAGLPICGIGVLWNKGYFKQKFWYKHGQIPDELAWDPHTYPGLVPLKNRVVIQTKEGPLHLRVWKYYVYSYHKKYASPLLLLDSNLDENSEKFKRLTDQLYRSDEVWWKIYQRVILGIGGMKALESLGYDINKYHLNEGHAAFALVEKYVTLENKEDMNQCKEQFAYTCHTPVAAGHDRFGLHDVSQLLDDDYTQAAKMFGEEEEGSGQINLTHMCLSTCTHVNAVAQKHGEITRLQFPDFADKVDAITNGVHLFTWLSRSFESLFDQYRETFGDWRGNQGNLSKVQELKGNAKFREDLFTAHQENKRQFLDIVKRWQLKENVLTIGWARRIAGYKRPSLIFHNIERIINIAKTIGPLQIVLAGKAHPNDDIGSAHIEEILDHIDQLNEHRKLIRVMILENYDTYFGKLLTNSVDIWLNNPLPPFEASGTSGMKAILNGVLQMSTLDGWVVEAKDDNIGWIFGYQHSGTEIGTEKDSRLDEDSNALYDTLEDAARLYYATVKEGGIDYKSEWIDKMINCIDRGAFFNTQRMINEYNHLMWGNKQVSV